MVFDSEDLVVFAEVDVVPDVVDGIIVAQANGMAGMESNTVLLGWPESSDLRADSCASRRLERLDKSMVIGRIGRGT